MAFKDKSVRFKTDKGYLIEGRIQNTWDEHLGKLTTETVDGTPMELVSYAMPKLKYYEEVFSYDWEDLGIHVKEDGTCIILSPIVVDNEVIDVLLRTRRVPFLSKRFKSLIDKLDVDLTDAYHFVYDTGFTLMFELYGKMNKHEIEYDEDLELVLINGRSHKGNLLKNSQIDQISNAIGIRRADKAFIWELGEHGYYYTVSPMFLERYHEYFFVNHELKNKFSQWNFVLNPLTCYNEISELLEELNKTAGKIVIEGVVFTIKLKDDGNQLKCKPKTVREGHSHPEGVPAVIIRKAIHKYYDEYSPIMLENFTQQPDLIYEFINNELSEEYNKEIIHREGTYKRTHRLLTKFIDEKYLFRYPKQLESVVDRFLEETPSNLSIPDYMREFAVKHPEYKNKSNLVFELISNKKAEV